MRAIPAVTLLLVGSFGLASAMTARADDGGVEAGATGGSGGSGGAAIVVEPTATPDNFGCAMAAAPRSREAPAWCLALVGALVLARCRSASAPRR